MLTDRPCPTGQNVRNPGGQAFRNGHGARHRVPRCCERFAETAREAVGWMALASSACRRIR